MSPSQAFGRPPPQPLTSEHQRNPGRLPARYSAVIRYKVSVTGLPTGTAAAQVNGGVSEASVYVERSPLFASLGPAFRTHGADEMLLLDADAFSCADHFDNAS